MVKKLVVWLFLFTTLSAENSSEGENPEESSHFECITKRDNELKECISKSSYAEQKKIFKELSPEQRKEYLALMAYHEYEGFLDNYNEYDWMRLYENLDDTEKNSWPETLYEQRIALYKMAYEASNGGSRYQIITRITDMIPYCKDARKKIESLVSDEESELLKKKFKAYMKKKFKI